MKNPRFKDKVKVIFDKRVKDNAFHPGDLVLRWDAKKEDKDKHGKFNNIWFGPVKVAKDLVNNTFILQNLNDEDLSGSPMSWCFLKHLFIYLRHWGIKVIANINMLQ